MAAAGSPQDAESTQLSNEVIGAMVTAVVALDRPAGRAFVSAAGRLYWSDRQLTHTIHLYVGSVSTLLDPMERALSAREVDRPAPTA